MKKLGKELTEVPFHRPTEAPRDAQGSTGAARGTERWWLKGRVGSISRLR